MYYVLNFRGHEFVPCETIDDAMVQLNKLFSAGVPYDEITVINRAVDECEMDVAAFMEHRKAYELEESAHDNDKQHTELEEYSSAYCNCCGFEFDISGWPIVCPNCGAEYDADKPYIVELSR